MPEQFSPLRTTNEKHEVDMNIFLSVSVDAEERKIETGFSFNYNIQEIVSNKRFAPNDMRASHSLSR